MVQPPDDPRSTSTWRSGEVLAEPSQCPVCDGEPLVLLAMRHPAMLKFTRELLEREFGCWIATETDTGDRLAATIDQVVPDLVVMDAGDVVHCCRAALERMPGGRVIVIGPEPDASYRAAAVTGGAGAWLPRERIGEELASEMRRVLGCVHDPCPPGHRRRDSTPSAMGARASACDAAYR